MLRLAGKLLILTGVLLLLAFVFQLPYLYQLFFHNDTNAGSLIVSVLWRFGLIAAGVLLIRSGRRMI